MTRGRITVIWGCMFSGKSERLLRQLRSARATGKTVAAFKHASDDRYGADQIVTHSGQRIDAIPISDPKRLLDLATDAGLVAIDEAQFFGSELVDVCHTLATKGCDVLVAGLDLDSWGQPFGPMPDLAAIADEVLRTQGSCACCGHPADHTQRLAPVEGQRMVGGPESYEPRCTACFQPPPAELRR